MVPTLCVVTPTRTLCVPGALTQSVKGCMPTRSGGHDQSGVDSTLSITAVCVGDVRGYEGSERGGAATKILTDALRGIDGSHALRGNADPDALRPRRIDAERQGCMPTRSVGTINNLQTVYSAQQYPPRHPRRGDDNDHHQCRFHVADACETP